MKIAVDARALTAPWGGIRRYTDSLLRALVRIESCAEYVLCGLGRETARESVLPGSGEGGRIHVAREPFPLARWVDQLWLASTRESVALYHGTNYAAPLWSRCPTVVTVHDLTVQLMPHTHPFRRRLRHRLLPAQLRRATRIIADSQHTRRDLLRCFDVPPECVDVVPLAASDALRRVTDADALDAARRRHRLPERFVLYLGALESRKNLVALVQAFGIVRRAGAPERLVLAGSGAPPHLAALRAEATRAGLVEGRDLFFAGAIAEQDVASLYSAATLFVYPSLYEGFGLPPLEAMACGVPVVCSTAGGLADVVAGAALTAEPGDAPALAAAMREGLTDAALRGRLAAAGAERAAQFTWRRHAEQVERLYREVLLISGGR
jgi:glycosyltransferase involved in cell wall biosynthesis